ncbi:hypothetical protein [Caulobacter hibisci]|uniref:Uncharacterized protein n=1 Tax=Caulobacter hibisci TaxID=2035993 RepID=A0ABS0SX19_9CAUL|nr:hypothetical protein [Caulobacter hibisci]MBI1684161.1 hypothetical protein [Caulobacter hibisci]
MTQDPSTAAQQRSPKNEAGLEAPPTPALDPTRKTGETGDPSAEDPGNGAD